MADLGWPASYDDDGNPVDMLADPMPDEPRTELGYARRLIAVYGDRLRTSRRGGGGWSGTASGGRTTPPGRPPGG